MTTLDELRETRALLTEQARRMADDPSFLGPFIALSMDVAVGSLFATRDGETYGMEPDPPHTSRLATCRAWIRRSARASALRYGRLAFPGQASPIEIVDGAPIGRLARPISPRGATVAGWLDALYRALSVGDGVSISWLIHVPRAALEAIARENGEEVLPYTFAIGDLWASIVKRDGRHADRLVDAIEMVGNAATTAGSFASEIDEPAVLALAELLVDGDYTRRLIDLSERHEAYFRDLEPIRNWISVRGIALQRLARARGNLAIVHGVPTCFPLSGDSEDE